MVPAPQEQLETSTAFYSSGIVYRSTRTYAHFLSVRRLGPGHSSPPDWSGAGGEVTCCWSLLLPPHTNQVATLLFRPWFSSIIGHVGAGGACTYPPCLSGASPILLASGLRSWPADPCAPGEAFSCSQSREPGRPGEASSADLRPFCVIPRHLARHSSLPLPPTVSCPPGLVTGQVVPSVEGAVSFLASSRCGSSSVTTLSPFLQLGEGDPALQVDPARLAAPCC